MSIVVITKAKSRWILWTVHDANEEFLLKGTERKLLPTVRRRRGEFLRHPINEERIF